MKTHSASKKRSAPVRSTRDHTDPNRCHFTSSDGRRCRMSSSAKHATLCLAHAKQEQKFTQTEQDISGELASLSGNLKTASDVNLVLQKLFSLLAQRRISRRDAVAFAYIAQLLLQTLSAVKREVQLTLGNDAWQETLEAALGIEDSDEVTEGEAELDEDKEESDQAPTGEEVEAEVSHRKSREHRKPPQNQRQPTAPASLSEFAAQVLSRHTRPDGNLPEPPAST